MDKNAFDLIPMPVVQLEPVRDENGVITDFTYAWANTTARYSVDLRGSSKDDVSIPKLEVDFSASTVRSRHAGSDGDQLIDVFARTVTEQKSQKLLLRAVSSALFEGEIFSIVTQPNGTGCLCVIQDIGDVVRERDEKVARLHLLEAACNDAVNGIAMADEDHRLVYANPALCQQLGYTEEELLKLRISDITDRDEQDVRNTMAESLHSAEIAQYITDRTYIAKSGEEILMEVAVSTTEAIDGTYRALAHFRDVREERAAQAALTVALRNAEEATRMKSEFLANMSHEIRTPLNGVIGMAQVLAFSDLTPEQTEHVEIIRDSGKNLMSLLNDILDLSKVEAGKIEISPIDIDLRHKLSRVFGLQDSAARAKGITLDYVFHPSVPSQVKLDPVRIHQCVTNLVSNAIKFTPEGKVLVAVTCNPVETGHEIVIHVSDSGIGIPADKLENIFESFEQADGSTTRNYGGTGLGLSITRKLARLMGGDLTVVSEEGRGSVFTLKVMSERAEPFVERRRSQSSVPAKPSFSSYKILVVDDNLVNRQVALSFLEAYEFTVSQAVNGKDALEKLDEEPFDLVLMDIHMPGMDGSKAFEHLRQSTSINKDIPVIATTADAMSGDRERLIGQGMNGYISKPVNEREMIGEIGRVLSLGEVKRPGLATGT